MGKFLRDYLEVNVDEVTKELGKASKSFGSTSNTFGLTGKIPSEEDLALGMRHRYGL